ncbi:MAG TPA: hypothetical protein VM577_01870, partial [Anaerovoracaceae bacterium]|nr:hypothetical protein [Anaerovoracaceae bacterium]
KMCRLPPRQSLSLALNFRRLTVLYELDDKLPIKKNAIYGLQYVIYIAISAVVTQLLKLRLAFGPES